MDVRHEASHNELPNLALLRLAAEHGLIWLRNSYWQRQHNFRVDAQDRLALTLQVATRSHNSILILGTFEECD